jgi:hypothetical protein
MIGIAAAASEDDSAATAQRRAGNGVGMCWKLCADLVTTQGKSSVPCTVMRSYQFGDRAVTQGSTQLLFHFVKALMTCLFSVQTNHNDHIARCFDRRPASPSCLGSIKSSLTISDLDAL